MYIFRRRRHEKYAHQVDVDDKIVLVLGSFLALFPFAFFPLNMTPGGGWFSSLGSSRAPSWHVGMGGRSTSLSLYDYTKDSLYYGLHIVNIHICIEEF